MNVVFLTRLFYPHVGGVEKHILGISNVLARKKHRITIISEKTAGNELGNKILLDLHKAIKVTEIPISKSQRQKKWQIWEWLFKNREIISSADVVHCHDVFFWYLPFKFIYPRKKVFTTFHGYEGKFPPANKAIIVRKLSEKMSDGNICVGDYIKKWYRTKPDLVTYGGVERSTIVKREIKDRIRIVFIGRIEEDNGIKVYSEILDDLDRNGIRYSFLALGEGKMRNIFLKKGRVKLSTNVLSEVKRADLVFASSYLSILEAFSQERPVVSVINNPLKSDYLLDTPFSDWVKASSKHEVLSDYIEDFFSSPDRYQGKLAEASAWAKQQTWENLASQYEEIWKESKQI